MDTGRRHNIQHNDIQHTDTQHNIKKCDNQLIVTMRLSIATLVNATQSDIYAECRYGVCRCAECGGTNWPQVR